MERVPRGHRGMERLPRGHRGRAPEDGTERVPMDRYREGTDVVVPQRLQMVCSRDRGSPILYNAKRFDSKLDGTLGNGLPQLPPSPRRQETGMSHMGIRGQLRYFIIDGILKLR